MTIPRWGMVIFVANHGPRPPRGPADQYDTLMVDRSTVITGLASAALAARAKV